MNPTLPIRPLNPSDTAEWLRMRLLLWPQCPPERHEEEVADYWCRAGERLLTLVAEGLPGRLVGFAELNVRPFAEGHWDGPVVYVEGIWVDDEARRCGVARRLLVAAQDWAREKGYAAMASDCLLENDISIRMHMELGFHEVERAVHFLKKL